MNKWRKWNKRRERNINFTVGEKSYIKRIYKELEENEKLSIDFLEMYEGSYSKELEMIFSSYHNWLNDIFRYMNFQNDRKYFHADNSREAIDLFQKINNVESQLHKHNIKLKEYYKNTIKTIKQFIQPSGGTPVPDEFEEIQLIEVDSIFEKGKLIQKKSTTRFNLQPIGQGSYAEVFKYKDEDYDKEIVVKRAKAKLDKKNIERFKREFEVMKELSSPYIVEVYKYDDSKNQYTMEFLDYTLEKYLENNNQTIIMEERFNIVNQIVRGFKFLNSKNVLHRDISPRNILIKEYEHLIVVKIADFGLVKLENSFLTSDQTEFRGSLNDQTLTIEGFKHYEIRHELYALTQLIAIVLSGKFNLSKCKDEDIKVFLREGTSSIGERFQNLKELKKAIKELKKILIGETNG